MSVYYALCLTPLTGRLACNGFLTLTSEVFPILVLKMLCCSFSDPGQHFRKPLLTRSLICTFLPPCFIVRCFCVLVEPFTGGVTRVPAARTAPSLQALHSLGLLAALGKEPPHQCFKRKDESRAGRLPVPAVTLSCCL